MQRSPFTLGSDARVVELATLEGRQLPVPATVRELLSGDHALLVEVSAPAHYVADAHVHDHESLVYILSGRVRATVAGSVCELCPGDAALHPAGVPHRMEAIGDSRWIEVKSPPKATWPTGECRIPGSHAMSRSCLRSEAR